MTFCGKAIPLQPLVRLDYSAPKPFISYHRKHKFTHKRQRDILNSVFTTLTTSCTGTSGPSEDGSSLGSGQLQMGSSYSGAFCYSSGTAVAFLQNRDGLALLVISCAAITDGVSG